jgi:hypothetical protein
MARSSVGFVSDPTPTEKTIAPFERALDASVTGFVPQLLLPSVITRITSCVTPPLGLNSTNILDALLIPVPIGVYPAVRLMLIIAFAANV